MLESMFKLYRSRVAMRMVERPKIQAMRAEVLFISCSWHERRHGAWFDFDRLGGVAGL